ncbi:MAG: type II toxin-antitoxin system RelE/ParE family toxin [Lachnospiraceae bacterium]|nr:type II toxin-antitoxin system RelE/ParE family toxin [Lachnospiraceae bacterium]
MYKIEFYEDKNGYSETAGYIRALSCREDKNSRINLTKIIAYFNELEQYGTRIGEPITKHLDDDIWELRPLRNRILYAYVENNTFIILHQFVKKTRKTPVREIERAKRNLSDYLRRMQKHDNHME